jgi:hypothetical protein
VENSTFLDEKMPKMELKRIFFKEDFYPRKGQDPKNFKFYEAFGYQGYGVNFENSQELSSDFQIRGEKLV